VLVPDNWIISDSSFAIKLPFPSTVDFGVSKKTVLTHLENSKFSFSWSIGEDKKLCRRSVGARSGSK
jgi:hypothetical protein